MTIENYRVCVRCVMDTSDPDISFDIDGVCNHCRDFSVHKGRDWFPDEQEGPQRLTALLNMIKRNGEGKEYDCILGLSGGVDSSYLALRAHEWGLRPLVMHVDAGWNSELAVKNIESIVKYCGFDLHTHVVDWEEMRDLQLAYLESGVSNQDVPQDHIFFSSLYHFATSNHIRFILSGGNWATEGIFPASWHGEAMDDVNLKAIHRRFGRKKLTQYKTISFFEHYFWYPVVRGMRTLRPLNFVPYVKEQALRELREKVGFKAYPRKHGESQFTKLFQNYYLPIRFGMDKRRPHFSSLIASGQLSREEALSRLEEPLYDPVELDADIAYFCRKLDISRAEFDRLMAVPRASHLEFPNWNRRYRLLKRGQSLARRLLGKDFKVYS
jgi:N-acetyl sugar amidotransferase